MEEEVKTNYEEDEIDILDLLGKLWARKKPILITAAVCFVIGMVFALFGPKKYTSSCVFVPQSNVSDGSRFSSLASLVGVDLDMTGNDGPLNPRVYPYILENTDYLLELSEKTIHFEDWAEPVALMDYYTDPQYHKFNIVSAIAKYTVGLPSLIGGKIKKSVDNSGPAAWASAGAGDSLTGIKPVRKLTRAEKDATKVIFNNLDLEVNSKEGYLTFSATMPEAIASAELCQTAFDLLRDYVTRFKVEKSRVQLSFVEQQCEDAKLDYETKQRAYARFVDSHQGMMSATADVERARLSSEAELARSLYSELARNLATVKVKVNEETIAFTDISPVTVPSSPDRSAKLVVIVWTLLGLFFASGWVLLADWWKRMKKSREA